MKYTCHLCKYSTISSVIWSLHLLLRLHRYRSLQYAASSVSEWGYKGRSLILVAVSSNKFCTLSDKESLVDLMQNSVSVKLQRYFVEEKKVAAQDIIWSSKDPNTAYLRFESKKSIETIMEKKNRMMVPLGQGGNDLVLLQKATEYTDAQWTFTMEGLLSSVVTVKDILTLK